MNDAMRKWAKALVGFSAEVKPGNTVAIQGGPVAEPLLRAVYREVLELGGLPVMLPIFETLRADMLTLGSDEQLSYLTPIEKFVRTEADVVVQIISDANTRSLAGVNPERQAIFQKARGELFKAFMEREGRNEVEWTLTLYPTDGMAQDADMSTADFAEFIYRACKLHTDDPVAAWKELGKEQQRLIDWLDGREHVHIIGPGTDLHLSVKDRTWINCDGKKNFPDGEIFTAPVENATNGYVTYSVPAIYGGREVAGIRLEFENGRVVNASAERGEDLLLRQLDVDEGARVIGEFAFGTNFDIQRVTRQMLFDEKIGGTIHIALGEAYTESGGTNTSAIHWDMLCDLRKGGRVEVDGEPFLVDGQYVV
ncbi:MAG: aminopeptidase [Thermomicrobiales bacterium]|jgi:aminopeptidase|nr:aminopeptidase [Thermomicrobiales bacterium]